MFPRQSTVEISESLIIVFSLAVHEFDRVVDLWYSILSGIRTYLLMSASKWRMWKPFVLLSISSILKINTSLVHPIIGLTTRMLVPSEAYSSLCCLEYQVLNPLPACDSTSLTINCIMIWQYIYIYWRLLRSWVWTNGVCDPVDPAFNWLNSGGM